MARDTVPPGMVASFRCSLRSELLFFSVLKRVENSMLPVPGIKTVLHIRCRSAVFLATEGASEFIVQRELIVAAALQAVPNQRFKGFDSAYKIPACGGPDLAAVRLRENHQSQLFASNAAFLSIRLAKNLCCLEVILGVSKRSTPSTSFY